MPVIRVGIDMGSAQNLIAQMERAQKELGKDLTDVVDWTARFVAGSLAASTKIAPKLRRVVRNPLFKAGKGATKAERAAARQARNDKRRAPFGVMAPTGPDRVMAFRPIYRSGEFGKIRFFDKKTMAWFTRDAANPKGRWEKIASGQDVANPEIIVPGIMNDRRRKIGRRGLAKKSWKWAETHTRRGGTATISQARDAITVSVYGGDINPTVRITNRLRYIEDAFKTKGKQAVTSTLARASEKMRNRINDRLEKMRTKANAS